MQNEHLAGLNLLGSILRLFHYEALLSLHIEQNHKSLSLRNRGGQYPEAVAVHLRQ